MDTLNKIGLVVFFVGALGFLLIRMTIEAYRGIVKKEIWILGKGGYYYYQGVIAVVWGFLYLFVVLSTIVPISFTIVSMMQNR